MHDELYKAIAINTTTIVLKNYLFQRIFEKSYDFKRTMKT